MNQSVLIKKAYSSDTRFHLKNGSLYAFWVSPDESGASHGYVGAGGPGFTGPRDTVGRNAVWARSQ